MESFKFVCGLVGLIAFLFGSIGLAQNAVIKSQCTHYARLSGATVDYSLSAGCLVRTKDGRVITLDAATSNSSDVTIREGK